jgi:hypothetical protein
VEKITLSHSTQQRSLPHRYSKVNTDCILLPLDCQLLLIQYIPPLAVSFVVVFLPPLHIVNYSGSVVSTLFAKDLKHFTVITFTDIVSDINCYL